MGLRENHVSVCETKQEDVQKFSRFSVSPSPKANCEHGAGSVIMTNCGQEAAKAKYPLFKFQLMKYLNQ